MESIVAQDLHEQQQQQQMMNQSLLVLSFIFTPLLINSLYLYLSGEIEIKRVLIMTTAWSLSFISWRLSTITTYQNASRNLLFFNLSTLVVHAFINNNFFNNITFGWMLVVPLYFAATIGIRHAFYSIALFIFIIFTTLIAQHLTFLNPVPDFIGTYQLNKWVHFPLMFSMMSFSLYRFNLMHIQSESNLAKALQEEQLQSLAKDTFLSNISHELRTPLNGIYGVLQIVKGATDTEKKLLDAAKHSAQALNRIVSDILDIQKLSDGKVELAPEWCNSQTFFNNIAQLHHSSAVTLNIELRVNVHPSVPKELYCDDTRLGQVINNLMGNAIKFTQQGRVTLSVHYHDDTLHLNVTDTGIGMDEAALSHLFDRFTQADASITKKYQGTGLGMAITKELVDLMHGTIEVTSTIGEGTTFSVAIPLQGSQQTNLNNADSNIRFARKDIRILLVDDVDTNTLVGREILRPHFSLVDTAASAKEALEKLAKQRYDILITDIGMPEISGEELHHIVKTEYPHLPVVALTGNAAEADKLQYLKSGFAGVSVKPIQQDTLLALIDRITGKHEQSQVS
jgi:signal transduction histidine kinase/ActR/RegA family two-component response regulator